MSLPKRSEAPREETWSIETVYADEAAWRVALAAVTNSKAEVAAFSGKLAEGGATLWNALQTRDRLFLNARRVMAYAGMLSATEGTNPHYAGMNAEAGAAWAGLAGAAAYIDPELLAIPQDRLDALLREEPRLRSYAHAFEVLRAQARHVRSAEVETLLAQAGEPLDTPASVQQAATYADMKFGKVLSKGVETTVSHSNADELLAEPTARKATWEAYADGHMAFANTLAASLQGSVKAYVFQARARGYASSIAMSLERNHIPLAVFDNLIDTFKASLPTWHKYWRLRRKAAGGAFNTCDAPIYDSPYALAPDLAMSYAEAGDVIAEGMRPLGEVYTAPMLRGLRSLRWVDRTKNEGKGSGAWSGGVPGTHPFIFMNWSDNLGSMSTLAHELGHSMHTLMINSNQPLHYCDYGLFIAEVASNFNQAMVRAHLLKRTGDRQHKLAILDEAFGNFHRYLFVMPTLARFERELYERVEAGGSINAPFLSERLVALFSEGYGGAVEIDAARLGAGWMNFPHLYAPFYVYQYATGIAAANALAKDVLEQGEPAAQRYLAFLKAGGSMYPLDALKLAGIDMSRPEPVARGFAVLAGMVDELERLID